VLVVKNKPVGPYRNVLVALDLGPGSEDLLRAARAIAPSARITAAHAYEVPLEGMMHRAGVSMDDVRKRRSEALANAVERIEDMARRAGGDDHRILAMVERAHPVRLVVDASRALHADLVVVARRKRHLLERLLVPSVARQMAGAVRSDVLVPDWLPAPLQT
jgi:nucleotide-binding universal stress UspA family protein